VLFVFASFGGRLQPATWVFHFTLANFHIGKVRTHKYMCVLSYEQINNPTAPRSLGGKQLLIWYCLFSPPLSVCIYILGVFASQSYLDSCRVFWSTMSISCGPLWVLGQVIPQWPGNFFWHAFVGRTGNSFQIFPLQYCL